MSKPPDTNANFGELLRLAFPQSEISWLVGEKEKSPSVQWVALSVDDLQKGDVLLLLAKNVAIDSVKTACEKGATGVVLVGNPPDKKWTGFDGLPVAALAKRDDLRNIQQLLTVLLVNQRAGLVERGYRIHSQLAQLSAEFAGLPGLVKAMVDISGRGVVVQDKRGQILADQSSTSLNDIWQDILAHINSLVSLPEELQDRKLAGKQETPVYQTIPGGLVRLVSPITVGGVARGYLSLIGLADEIDSLDYLVAEQGVMVCAMEMARSKAVREMEKRLQSDLLTALLHNELSPRDASLWAQTMGLDLNQAHTSLRFSWLKQKSPSRRRLETLIHGEVARLGLKVIISAMASEVICFCEIFPGNASPLKAIELAQKVINQGQNEYPESPLICGVGIPALDLNEWNTSFRQAGQALEMARRLESNQPLYFPDLSIYRLLFQIEHHPELIAFQEEMLGPLLAQEGGKEFIHTLESYFAHNANISQTAEALFLHRNTLIYRLERIRNILNMDLEKPETRLALQLALYIHRMSGSQS